MSCACSFGPTNSACSNVALESAATPRTRPVAGGWEFTPFGRERDAIRRVGRRHDGRNEVVLQGRDPAVAHVDRELAIIGALDVELAVFRAVEDRGPVEGVAFHVEV